MIDHYPKLIVQCASVADVVTAVRTARQRDPHRGGAAGERQTMHASAEARSTSDAPSPSYARTRMAAILTYRFFISLNLRQRHVAQWLPPCLRSASQSKRQGA